MQQQTPNLSDKDLLMDLLNEEKQIMGLYQTFISEAGCPNLRNVLTSQFNEVSNDQYRVFNAMSERGFYAVKQAQPNEVQQASQKMTQTKQQLDSI
ncbi:MAG: spore coat protein [Christensenellales bacterium]|jgi:spore coat protein F